MRYIDRTDKELDTKELTYKEIVQGCRSGERRAQTAFYDSFAPRLFATAFRLLSHSAEAEDAVQEVLLRVLTDTKMLLPDHYDMQRRLNRMTVNEAVDRLRRRKLAWDEWDENMEIEDDGRLEEILLMEEHSGMLRLAIENLPCQCRTVLQLSVIEEMETEEIAALLNISPSGVRAHLTRAKQKLINWFKYGKQS